MNIVIKQNGFVTGDFLEPVAYAGEANSRIIDIVHPTFDNAIYQLIIIKDNHPYVLGIDNGQTILPPSLTNIATKLKCQFVATRNISNNNDENTCNCGTSSINDCKQMIFKSDEFTLIVAEGLNLNNLTPIPPYEQLVEIYDNINKAKLMVEQAKVENMNLLDTINERISVLQNIKSSNGNVANDEEVSDMIDDVYKNVEPGISNEQVATDEEIDSLLNDAFK